VRFLQNNKAIEIGEIVFTEEEKQASVKAYAQLASRLPTALQTADSLPVTGNGPRVALRM
jgi:hypothetical protein